MMKVDPTLAQLGSDEEELLSSFLPAEWLKRRARAAIEQWNAEHRDHLVPWEWLEEALMAWRSQQEATEPEEFQAHLARFNEFRQQLPRWLVAEIFGQDLPRTPRQASEEG